MSDNKPLAAALAKADAYFDRFRHKIGLYSRKPAIIVPYLGYATRDTIYLSGRVLHDNGVRPAEDNDTLWDNLVNMYRRFETDEIPGAVVTAGIDGQQVNATTNDEGFFNFEIPHARRPASTRRMWYVTLDLIPDKTASYPMEVDAIDAPVLAATEHPTFGVISDIDDTVLQTNATDILRMARNTLLGNSRTRLPFDGVAAFYRALVRGHGDGDNPIFYVSSSPFNLYDLLSDFFEVRGIPAGPLFLTDWGTKPDQLFIPSHDDHKSRHIQALLDRYPNLPFILIGDSGQRDPEIYADVVKDNPGRLKAIYIRDVSLDNDRADVISTLNQGLVADGVDMVLVPNTYAAAKHAIDADLLPLSALNGIREEAEDDAKPETPLSELM